AFGRPADILHRQAVRLAIQLFQVLHVLCVVDKVIVIDDVETELLARRGDSGLSGQRCGSKQYDDQKTPEHSQRIISEGVQPQARRCVCYYRCLMISLKRVSKVFEGKRKATALD